jgi:protein-tyrosine phosphatase
MEKKHKQRILENFPAETVNRKIVVLDIPDEYEYMDEELIENIKVSVEGYLNNVQES